MPPERPTARRTGSPLFGMRLSPWPRTPQALQELIADPAHDPIRELVDAERAHAERLLNYVRGIVLVVLTIAAIAYSPRISATLDLLNFAVIIPLAAWTIAQHVLMRRHARAFRALAILNPVVDITAITVLLIGYGVWGAPVLAVKTPMFLAYFAILAARPVASSTRITAFASALATVEYLAVVVFFVASGRVSITSDPVQAVSSPDVSFLDQGARVLLLLIAGSITTYASAWHERLLRRALNAQVHQAEEQRALESRLRDADKLAALGTLAASVAHEVANPLSSIAALADLMHETATDPVVREDAGTIGKEARRTERVIRELLQVARPRAPEWGPVALEAMTERALSLLRLVLRDADITVQTRFDREAPLVKGDEGRLEQVILNLVINASQALEKAPRPRTIRIATKADDGNVRYIVEDSGTGLSPEILPRIFERFFTTKPAGKGTGLGLWIVRQIVEEHGGRIKAANTPEGGARFDIMLPGEGTAAS